MALSSKARRASHVLAALYLVGAVILIDQGADLIASIFPLQLSNPQWRFGAFGIALARVTPVLLADVMILVAATGLEHRGFLRFWAAIHLVAGLGLAAGTALFLLDATQLRANLQEGVRRTVVVHSGRAALLGLLGVGYSVCVAIFVGRSTGPERASRAPIVIRGGA